MANAFEIPWEPLDLNPGASFLAAVLRQNAADDRSNEYLAMQKEAMRRSAERESHETKRKDEQERRRRAIEAFQARPSLERLARRSPSAANLNPYGFRFEEAYDLPANVEGPEMSPAAEAARFQQKPPTPQEFNVPEQPPQGTLAAGQEGPELNPTAEAARFMLEGPQAAPRVLDPGEEGPQQEQPEALPIMAQAAVNTFDPTPGPMGKRRIYGSFGDQRYELPEESDTLGLGEEWDAMYGSLVDNGADPLEARKFVFSEHKADRDQRAIGARAAEAAKSRDLDREDRQAQERAMGLDRDDKLREAEKNRLARARRGTGAGGGGGGVGGKVDQAAVQLQKEIDAAKAAGKPMELGAIKERGLALGIPMNPTKSIKTSVKGILDDISKVETLGARTDAATTKKDEDVRARTVNWRGGSGVAPTVKSAEEFRVFENSAQQLDGALSKLEENYKKHGVELSALSPFDALKSDAVREREAIMESVKLPAKEVGRLGALSGPDEQIMIKIAGGKAGQLLGDEIGIRNMREWLARARKSGKASLGIQEAPGGGGQRKPDRKLRDGGTARWNPERGGYERVQ